MSIVILNSIRKRTEIGNSLLLLNTINSSLIDLQILGETLCKKAVFDTATVRIDGVTSLPFIAGASLVFNGFLQPLNNKTVTLSSISGTTMAFPAATFTAACELQGTISDGVTTFNIAVSPDAQQSFSSLLNFDYHVSGKNLFDKSTIINPAAYINGSGGVVSAAGWAISDFIRVKAGGTYKFLNLEPSPAAYICFYDLNNTFISSVTNLAASTSLTIPATAKKLKFSNTTSKVDTTQLEYGITATTYSAFAGNIAVNVTLKDTANNQLENRGIPLTYNADGTVATWASQDRVVKRSDGKWYLGSNTKSYALQASDIQYLVTTYTNVDVVATAIPFKSDLKIPTSDAVATKNAIMEDRISVALYSRDNVASIGKFYISITGILAFVVAKGAYADITAAKTAFTGKKIIYVTSSETYTELCIADQTALNSVAKTFAGITNIMLSTDIGQIQVTYKVRR